MNVTIRDLMDKAESFDSEIMIIRLEAPDEWMEIKRLVKSGNTVAILVEGPTKDTEDKKGNDTFVPGKVKCPEWDECERERKVASRACNQKSANGFICTRGHGHEGPHHGHCTQFCYEIWEDF